ncbi:MAG: enoyl-CoA hydratase-related protein [Pseudomonadota bacterium]
MSDLEITRDGHVATITLNRPASSNALGPVFWKSFADELAELDLAGEIRVLILRGEGRHFCAGMDLMAFAAGGATTTETPAEREAFFHAARYVQSVIAAVERVRFPVIAAIQGACLGAGLELISACNLRFASSEAYFAIEESNTGMMADLGSLQRLPTQMPQALVHEMAFMGTRISAERAHQAGFLNALAEDEEALLLMATEAAHNIAAKAPLALAGTKAALTFSRDHSVPSSLEYAAVLQAAIWNTPDIMAAMHAKSNKTDGEFAELAAIRTLRDRG